MCIVLLFKYIYYLYGYVGFFPGFPMYLLSSVLYCSVYSILYPVSVEIETEKGANSYVHYGT